MTKQITPVTVLTGFLGAGKTTLMISLLKQFPSDYKVAILKNEYGDVEIDSALSAQSSSNIAGVTEMLNGCLCCVLTGQVRAAIQEIQEKYAPDRILVETSGSAFPATISIQLRDLSRELETADVPYGIRLDGIVNVIDAENFTGYADTSQTALMQAQYTDLIVFNKWEGVDERKFDLVWDRVNDVNTDTPKIKSNKGTVPLDVIVGLDSKLSSSALDAAGHDSSTCADPGHDHSAGEGHSAEIETLHINLVPTEAPNRLADFASFLKRAPRDEIYRIKFVLRVKADDRESCGLEPKADASDELAILNWAFGRYDYTVLDDKAACERALATLKGNDGVGTIMVGRGDSRMWLKRINKMRWLGPHAEVTVK
ncbi:CobW/HypB/UreG, nucleotide-binding domain-containing protein [Dipodascopsis tothii]|uniref:CobW/HypB/UreG, nucleotide-binding domain-containing protein n=1 Tax=Dipodascopsis tothii TaxID=44089 RepID=UPI0034CF2CF9